MDDFLVSDEFDIMAETADDGQSDVFTFDDIMEVPDNVLETLVVGMDTKELSKALISESAEIRKKFYANMDLVSLKTLNRDMMDTERFTVFEKRNAQMALIGQIAQRIEIKKRLESGYPSLGNFTDYLLTRGTEERRRNPYGLYDGEATVIRFSDAKNGEEILADIERKNEAENMGNQTIPGTKIKLVNFSVCPKCAKVFSFKDLSDYYAKPKRDARYKNMKEQFRQDTRVYCEDCGAYFLPALVISDGTPRTETQFLCRIQTMNAIEDFYRDKRGAKVLSKNAKNLIKKTPLKSSPVTAIRNDVFIKDMEARPTLITNLLQYTPAKFVMNIIDGSNYRKEDPLFGDWA